MTQYCLGFLLNNNKGMVLLLERSKTWQKGRLNGVGGHVEAGETPLAAMYREAYEEADLKPEDHSPWELFAVMKFGRGDEVFCYKAMTPGDALMSYVGGPASTKTEEVVGAYAVSQALLSKRKTLSNIPWLLAMALDENDGRPCVLEVSYKETP